MRCRSASFKFGLPLFGPDRYLGASSRTFCDQSKSVFLSSLETGIVMGTGFFVTMLVIAMLAIKKTMLVKPSLLTLWGTTKAARRCIFQSTFFCNSPLQATKRTMSLGDPDSSFKYPPSWSKTSFHRWRPRHLSRQHPFWNGLNKQI